MHDTDATMMTSSRSSSERVAAWRMRSICSLIDGFFLDVGVGARHVGFGLVVVVVGDEVLDRVVGEEALELAVELGGERLVRRQDQCRALRRLDDLRHREGLAGAGDAEQHLVAFVLPDAFDQFGDGVRLVALRLVLRDDLERDAAFAFLGTLGAVRHERRQSCRRRSDASPSAAGVTAARWRARTGLGALSAERSDFRSGFRRPSAGEGRTGARRVRSGGHRAGR